MCSKKVPARTQTRVSERFGAVLTASTTVLAVEAPVWAITLFTLSQIQENPGTGNYGLLFFAAIPLALVALVLAVLVSLGAVMPLLVADERLGRRVGGRGAWRRVPTLAALGVAPLAVAAGLYGGLQVEAWVWAAGTASLTAPALVARRLLLPGRPPLAGGLLFWRIVLYGALTVTAAGVLGIGLSACFGYEPPTLSTQRAVGVWSDGKGGTLVLAADGTATADAVGPDGTDGTDYGAEDSSDVIAPKCSGTGTWAYDKGDGPWTQQVRLAIDGCSATAWEVLGTAARPKLFVFLGDPDSWDLYALRRAPA